MNFNIRIGTRESELAVWQATLVKNMLAEKGYSSTLVFIKSEGDIDLTTPLYEMGVQGIFTKSLDIALLNNSIDIAVHSMKDVPTQLPAALMQAAVLERGNYRDIFVPKQKSAISTAQGMNSSADWKTLSESIKSDDAAPARNSYPLTVATSSIRRRAQWLHRYPNSVIENLRGNINTRLKKVAESDWDGAVFAAAGLERINLTPSNAIELEWMLPAPAQGAIMVVCRETDAASFGAAKKINHLETAICTKLERDFLRELLGGCSTPVSALAQINKNEIYFKGNIVSPDGKNKVAIEKEVTVDNVNGFGKMMASLLLQQGGREIAEAINHAK